MRLHNLLRLAPLVLILTSSGLAQDRTIVRTVQVPSKDIYSLAAKYGASDQKLVKNSDGDNVYVLSVPSGSQAAALAKDKDVQSMELDAVVNLPLQHAASGKVSRPPNPNGYVNFFGTSAWGPYVNQPAASIIRIPESRRCATGAGIVAII